MRNKRIWLFALSGLLSLSLAGMPVLAEALTEEADQAADYSEAYWYVEDAADYVTPGEYKGLDAEKTIYTLTDEDTQIELENILYDQAEWIDISGGASIGDTVDCDLTVSLKGDEETIPGYTVDLGYEELGAAFDQQLVGHAAGETLSFSITYTDDDEVYDEWIGQTVDFTVKITNVKTTSVPEFNDEWVKENSEFEDTESYLADLAVKLKERSDRQSTIEAAENVLTEAVETSVFDGYPQDLYDSIYELQVGQYEMMAEMFGISLEEMYESYEMSEEDIAGQTVEMAEQILFVNRVAQLADENDDLALSALTEKVSLFLLDNANVTESEYDYSEEDLIFEDSSAEDIEFGDWEWEEESDAEGDDWEDDNDYE